MIECVTDFESYPSLKDEWNALYRESGVDNVFLTYAWIRNWMATFSTQRHVVLLNRIDGRLVSLGVFRREQRCYSFISGEHSCWPGILCVSDDDAAYEPFFEYFKAAGATRIEMNGGLVRSSCESDRLGRPTPPAPFPARRWGAGSACLSGWFVVQGNPSSYRAIDIPDSMSEFLASRPKKVRSELVRKARRLQRAVPEAVLHTYQAPMDVKRVFEMIREVELDSWKSKRGTAIISSARETQHYCGVLGLAEDDVCGAVYFLEAGGVPLAFVLGVVHKRRFYAIKTSYKNAYASYSPGQVLFYRLIERFCKAGDVKTIELLGNETRWIRELATRLHSLCDWLLLRKSLKSAAVTIYVQKIRPWGKWVVRRHPRWSRVANMASRIMKR